MALLFGGRRVCDPVAEARVEAHDWFDRLWKGKGRGARSRAYRWMQQEMGMGASEAHIALFGVQQCRRLVLAVRRHLATLGGEAPCE